MVVLEYVRNFLSSTLCIYHCVYHMICCMVSSSEPCCQKKHIFDSSIGTHPIWKHPIRSWRSSFRKFRSGRRFCLAVKISYVILILLTACVLKYHLGRRSWSKLMPISIPDYFMEMGSPRFSFKEEKRGNWPQSHKKEVEIN